MQRVRPTDPAFKAKHKFQKGKQVKELGNDDLNYEILGLKWTKKEADSFDLLCLMVLNEAKGVLTLLSSGHMTDPWLGSKCVITRLGPPDSSLIFLSLQKAHLMARRHRFPKHGKPRLKSYNQLPKSPSHTPIRLFESKATSNEKIDWAQSTSWA